jgi:lipopolysaccharide export system permease protein
MRRLDKLILKAFFGPFFLTTLVATFILLIQYMLKYFDDFVGKNLGVSVLAELMFYFALNMLQVALPLGVLVSSLMTFGNLGEHFELTAIKSAGVSLLRTMRPIFVYVVILSIGAFYFNDLVVPAANLKAYSLLYDIKHKKPALDIKAGVFYDGIPNYSIKAGRKLPDNKTLMDVMIYDHTLRDGNKRVILADSSLMYTMYNDKYLKLELFDGVYYDEVEKRGNKVDDMYRTKFDQLNIVFSLSSFDLKRTKEELFRNNRQMKNIAELTRDLDSLKKVQKVQVFNVAKSSGTYLNFHSDRFVDLERFKTEDTTRVDSVTKLEKPKKVQEASFLPLAWLTQDQTKEAQLKVKPRVLGDTVLGNYEFIEESNNDTLLARKERGKIVQAKKEKFEDKDDLIAPLSEWTLEDFNGQFDREYRKVSITQNALNKARNFKVNITGVRIKSASIESRIDSYNVEKYKKYSQAFACIVMFLIGAPLGAIIKKGGLGVPVIVSIFFFIIYYVLTISSEKWAKANVMDGEIAVWTADVILFPFGLFFLRQARIDARLFDWDFYLVVLERVKTFLEKRKILKRSV